jgi:hypothetical protein
MHTRYRAEVPLDSLINHRVSFTASTTIVTPQLIFLRDSRLRSGIVPVCDISADLSGMSGALEPRWGRRGFFWSLDFSIGIEFGGVELQAYVEWVEKVGKALNCQKPSHLTRMCTCPGCQKAWQCVDRSKPGLGLDIPRAWCYGVNRNCGYRRNILLIQNICSADGSPGILIAL